MTTNKLDAIRSLYGAIERAGMSGAFRFRDVEEMAVAFSKAARALDRINLARCNGVERWDAKAGMRLASWHPEDEERAERLETKHRDNALKVLDRLNAGHRSPFTIRWNCDPRGASIQLFVAPDDPGTGNASAYF
jgi:hypothetical protein